MKISVFDIINSKNAVNQEDGTNLYDFIASQNSSDVVLSFEGIDFLSTLFLNESIGRMVVTNPKIVSYLKFEYPEGKSLFSSKVEDVIENALMGDDYDQLVDAAKMAL